MVETYTWEPDKNVNIKEKSSTTRCYTTPVLGVTHYKSNTLL